MKTNVKDIHKDTEKIVGFTCRYKALDKFPFISFAP